MDAQVNCAFSAIRRLKTLAQSLFRGSTLKQAPRAGFKVDNIEVALAACFARHANRNFQRLFCISNDTEELTSEKRALQPALEIGSGSLFQGDLLGLVVSPYLF
jgi:hypothetical protein